MTLEKNRNRDYPPGFDATGRMIRATPPVPRPRPPILSGVPDEEIKAFIRDFEKPIEHFYKDPKGGMTIGIGELVPDIDKARSLPLYVYKDNVPHRRATASEIDSLYKSVQSMPHGQGYGADFYRPGVKNNKLPNIQLKNDDIEELFSMSLRSHAGDLRRVRPDIDDQPPAAQKAMMDMMDMMFNMGADKFNRGRWPDFFEAIDEKNWSKAAVQSHRITPHEKRNTEIYKLLWDIKRRN